MFFRREKPRQISFDDRINALQRFKIDVQSQGAANVKAVRQGYAATIEDAPELGQPRVGPVGIIVGDEIAVLVDGGFQKFFVTPSGRRIPALASHLKALHDFQEDLKEGLGLTSLYNESLGTTFSQHMYDRVADRDRGVPTRPWQPPPIRVD
jgi:hypothetical protein